MAVKGVALDARDQTPFIILQEEGGPRSLPVEAGAFETGSVIIQLEGIVPPRPLSHDLLASLLKEHGFSARFLELHGMDGNGYRARFVYVKDGAEFGMEMGAPDGIALAIRTDVPIMVDPVLLQTAPARACVRRDEEGREVEFFFLEPDWRPAKSFLGMA